MLECSPDCLKVLDAGGNVLFFNANGLCAMEIDDLALVTGAYWPSFWPQETSPLAQIAVADALAGRVGAFQGFCPTAKGTPKWWDVVVTSVPNPDGAVERLIVVSRDVTTSRAEEARKAALATELAHRINNTLGLVQAIAAQTRRKATDLDGFYDVFSARLSAMAEASRAVMANDWNGADLASLAKVHLRTFLTGIARISIDGPEVLVRSEIAQPLALALNELATNATKYGALSVDQGQVALTWAPAADGVRLEWRESGGPAVVTPTRTGLGSALIKSGIPGAEVDLAFKPDGVVCVMKLPL